jgi:16S rRNA processing protein RimM
MSEQPQRGLAGESVEPRFLVIGRIVKPHGVRGDVLVEVHTDEPDRFTWLDRVYVGREDPVPVAIERVRFHKTFVLLKLAGYDDRESAKLLRDQWLQVPEEEGLPLEEGEYYLYQIVGATVYSDDGKLIGELTQVLETKANNVFVVKGQFGEVLLPDTVEVVKEVDLDKGQITVHLLPGLLP